MTARSIRNLALCRSVFAILSLILAPLACPAATVWTQHYDNDRTGANLSESMLNTSNVNQATFGKLFSIPVDDWVWAEPLYVPGLTVDGAVHNVLYIATMGNSIYAFDADNGILLWHTNYGTPPTFAQTALSCGLINPGRVGIMSTPVIDTSTNTLYFVHFNLHSDGTYHQYIRAVDITTGLDKFNSPQEILLSARGVSPFLAQYQTQRTALTLANGMVYMGWANDADCGPYHGWLAGYNASDLSQPPAVFVDTTGDSTQGGIWMGGNGLVTDASGNLYVATGNGLFDGGANFGDSILKLSPSLSLLDSFTPYNQATLGSIDGDLGSAGVVGIPNTNRIIAGGKSHRVFLIDGDDLGSYKPTDDQVLQEFQASNSLIESTPVFWNDPNTPTYYVWSMYDVARAYSYNGSQFNTMPVSTSTISNANFSPGLSISANGSNPGTAILWANVPSPGDNLVPGTLYAFDATNLHTVLYGSNQNAARDAYGYFIHFTSPVVTNGKVYVGSVRLVGVYGLLSSAAPAPSNLTASPANASVSLSWTGAGGATSYNIYRATATGGEQAPAVVSVAGTAFTDTGLTNGQRYFYFVTAAGVGGESLPSNEANTTPTVFYPILVAPASAAPNPVTGTTTKLSVLGGYFNGESKLTYTWSSTGPAAVTFSANGSNAAKNCTATFTAPGSYIFTVTLKSPPGNTTTSSVGVTVNLTTTMNVTPGPAINLAPQTPQYFTASLVTQFGPVSPQPTISWTLGTGSVGSVGVTGLYHSGPVAGTAIVTANGGGWQGSTTVTVAAPVITVATPPAAVPNPVKGAATNLSVVGAYNGSGGAAGLTYTWSAGGPAPVSFSQNGTNAARNCVATLSEAGTYIFSVNISDALGNIVPASTSPVTVNQTFTSVGVSPASITLPLATTQQFTAVAYDQFGIALATQPTLAWVLVSPSVGSVSSVTGLYHSGLAAGSATVKAKSGIVGGIAQVTVN